VTPVGKEGEDGEGELPGSPPSPPPVPPPLTIEQQLHAINRKINVVPLPGELARRQRAAAAIAAEREAAEREAEGSADSDPGTSTKPRGAAARGAQAGRGRGRGRGTRGGSGLLNSSSAAALLLGKRPEREGDESHFDEGQLSELFSWEGLSSDDPLGLLYLEPGAIVGHPEGGMRRIASPNSSAAAVAASASAARARPPASPRAAAVARLGELAMLCGEDPDDLLAEGNASSNTARATTTPQAAATGTGSAGA
jgi:hypothetical protein